MDWPLSSDFLIYKMLHYSLDEIMVKAPELNQLE